jgi:NAD(P)-dependent dehydrogenase (short-subunit alcohol dehydrogenase family)
MHSGKVILITGGTGQQGSAAARALLRRGWKARVLTRDASSANAEAVRAMGADLVSGDLDDRQSLDRAMTGVHGGFCVPPLVTSFMPAGSFKHQLAGNPNSIPARSIDHRNASVGTFDLLGRDIDQRCQGSLASATEIINRVVW